MPQRTEQHAPDRLAMLKGVYEDNLRLGELQRFRRPRLVPRPRHWARWTRWALLGVTLVFGPALGYLGPTVFMAGQDPVLSTLLESPAPQPQPQPQPQPVQSVHSPDYSPSVLAELDLAALYEPVQLPEVESGNWSDFAMLLRDNQLPVTALFGLDVKTIVIDAGHGGADPGAIGAHGTMEKDIALDIALRLRDRLHNAGRYRILMTRDADTTLRLNQRVEFANENQADLFVSIHVNAFPDVRVKTIETYYFGAPPDTATTELAKLENSDSHYGMADFKNMLSKIAHTMKHQESAALATSIQDSLFQNIHKLDHGMRNFGVKTAPFVVLLGVDAPSVLAEISCITNVDEEKKLNTPAYRDKIASFLEKGIHQYLRQIQPRTAGDNTDDRQRNG
jgi:N-acetylmuramoyl-L-alanine amidase